MNRNDIIQMYLDGITPTEIEKITGKTQGVLNTILMDIRKTHAKHHKEAAYLRKYSNISKGIVSDHISGMSINAISVKYGIIRSTAKKIVEYSGYKTRNRSESMCQRMADTTFEERQKLASAANKSVKGRLKSDDWLIKQANTKAITLSKIGRGERQVQKWIEDFGYNVTPQGVVYKFNIDILFGNVAVEVHSTSAYPHTIPSLVDRAVYLLNSGYDVLYIHKGRYDLTDRSCADYAISMFEFRRSYPSAGCEYRVIGRDGDLIARARSNGNHLTFIPMAG